MRDIDAFITRWEAASGAERANYQLFLTELCALLGLPMPEPAREDTRDNAYVFERRVTFRHGDGTESPGFADLYKRGHFVLEAKKIRKEQGKAFDDTMLRARGQAEQYARALPVEEGRPPFLMVVDVGQVIELYAEFSRSGATYTPFPDPRSHRIRLAELRDEAVRERLRAVWTDPQSLDPSRRSAKVTREIAAQLARIAQTLEARGHRADQVAGFLTRCLFSMFAEDVGLLPKRAFVDLLESLKDHPDQFVPLLGDLWRAMDKGEFSVALRTDLLKFNGKLFKNPEVLPLDRDLIGLVLEAARFDWRDVEPAIFGTLLERALSPEDRHALGAHYTPRAYVERLVLPTVVEPLREDWKNAQAAALLLAGEGKLEEARTEVRNFHHALCEVRVLDPACGSGNFLYVTLEHLKRLEGEVLNQLDELGDARGRLELEGVSVDPHQFLGIELNPRAAALAELVLWIGYLQWHFRTRGQAAPPQPILKDFHNIECRDAVLAHDGMEFATDAQGKPVMRWDGKTMKVSPVTGEPVPDERAQVALERYRNPRKAEWPKVDFVIGNPPFIGSKRMREVLGDGYVDGLQAAWPEVPESTDLVMRWWHMAAVQCREGRIRRFGLITTNSLRQTYVRRAVDPHLLADPPVSLVFAVPDHPWVDAADGAAVRIAMTVGELGRRDGRLVTVVAERSDSADGGEDLVAELSSKRGLIHPDLSIGVDVTRAISLQANSLVCSVGMKTIGAGFQITKDEAISIGLGTVSGIDQHVRPYINGRDFVSTSRELFVIDFFGLDAEQVRSRYPDAYQHLLTKVKPEREQNRNALFRANWWVIGHARPQFRAAVAGLRRYIVTVETQKHRFFAFMPVSIVPDSTLVTFCSENAAVLGVLSSDVHVAWSLAAGGTLEDRPRYNKSRCFEPFPFPRMTGTKLDPVRDLAEQIDAHRKRQQAAHPGLTLTGIYNVLEALKSHNPLNEKEKTIDQQGLVSTLKQLHDELDLAVLEAYGWSDLAPLMQVANGNAPAAGAGHASQEEARLALDGVLLERLVDLNAERAAEEARGMVRWLRPEFQHPTVAPAPAKPAQGELHIPGEEEKPAMAGPVAGAAPRQSWPKELPEQVRLVADVITGARAPLGEDLIADAFTGRGPWKRRLPQIVDTLVALGRARRVESGVIAVR